MSKPITPCFDLVFLSAAEALTKKFYLENSKICKTSYPSAYLFTSHQEKFKTIQEFYTLVTKYAALGHCLLKGTIQEPLANTPRAGATTPIEKTQWICLDLDGVTGFKNTDDFLAQIGLQNVSYVIQESATSRLLSVTEVTLHAHIFIALESPAAASIVKLWLQGLNLLNPILSSRLKLTKSNCALRYPLDITTCQNDKLIYIAPPIFESGIKDPWLKGRISMQTRLSPTWKFPEDVATSGHITALLQKKIEELRQAAGLPKRKKYDHKFSAGVEYLANPETCIVTDVKKERGFVYLNINGGDSYGYYHPETSAEFIFNFKGEPVYKTEEWLPDYYHDLQAKNYRIQSDGTIYLVFRDFDSACFYNLIYNPNTDNLQFARAASEGQLKHFMKQHGQPLGDFIPDWSIVYDPYSDVVVDFDNKQINTFRKSVYMKLPPPLGAAHAQCPTKIARVVSHLCDGDAATINHFFNWIAVIFNDKVHTRTAWLFQGIEGTGKGVLYNNILKPLLGDSNCASRRMEELEGDFTGFMEGKLLVFIDEIGVGDSYHAKKITAKLKNIIVEPTISIRRMYRETYEAPNYINLTFAGNDTGSIEVSTSDRRFNICPYIEAQLGMSQTDIDNIVDEIEGFTYFLRAYPRDMHQASLPIDNASRQQFIETGMQAVDVVSKHLLSGDLEWFYSMLPVDFKRPSKIGLTAQDIILANYVALMKEIIVNNKAAMTRDDLMTLYTYLVDNVPRTPNKFTSFIKHHKVHIKPLWVNNKTVRGIDINWQGDRAWRQSAAQDLG